MAVWVTLAGVLALEMVKVQSYIRRYSTWVPHAHMTVWKGQGIRCPYHAAGAEWSYLQRRHPQLVSGGCALSSWLDVCR